MSRRKETKVICAACAVAVRCSRMLNHLKNQCVERFVCCEYCNNKVKVLDKLQHYSSCIKWPFICPFCSINLIHVRSDREFKEHKKVCANKARPCSMALVGCPYLGPRKDVVNHVPVCEFQRTMIELLKETMEKADELENTLKQDREFRSRELHRMKEKVKRLSSEAGNFCKFVIKDTIQAKAKP